jgi:hypothetical protein
MLIRHVHQGIGFVAWNIVTERSEVAGQKIVVSNSWTLPGINTILSLQELWLWFDHISFRVEYKRMHDTCETCASKTHKHPFV